ncbi:HNH endonuclease [Actinoplanes teichomyceticus]|uniref:HNH endonuclease n=1 Tax=Actinoplanes teichomyceticus TaxID=1867 RepID=A0A561VGI6_ACTTI|nr:HNH endonuclease signature motif containing protein [Actinoplanes teichomyceticus]TWG10723.1 HNH endonuclease [Actinoplanes teichomyceticus]
MRCTSCAESHNRERRIQYARQYYADNYPRRPEVYTCGACGLEFGWKARGGNPPRNCLSCTTANLRQRQNARNRAATTARRPVVFTCVICGEARPVARHGQIPVCCRDCRPEYARRAEQARRDANALPPTVWRTTCLGCGKTIEQIGRNGNFRKRCPSCAERAWKQQSQQWLKDRPEIRRVKNRNNKRNRRLARRDPASEKFTDIEIYERDGWVCGICKQPVDRTLIFPNLWSVSLDHVIPLVRGGKHRRDNVQCAHWLCNSRKTYRLESEMNQLRRRSKTIVTFVE